MQTLSVVRPYLIFVVVFLSFGSGLQGSDTEKDAEKQLKLLYEGETFIIRHFYVGNHLKYDSEGTLISKAETGSWTLYGFYKIESLALKKNKMELKGKQLFWSYDRKEKRSKYIQSSGKTRIEIILSNGSLNAGPLQKALSKIFMAKNESLQDVVPYYWKYFVSKEFGTNGYTVERNPVKRLWSRADAYVDPKPLSQPLPPYTSIAQKARLSGSVHIAAIINKEGRVIVKDIITPLGLGLDESAIDTISKKWEFVPASQNGVPVECETDITIEFIPYP